MSVNDISFNEVFEEFVGGRLETEEDTLNDPEYKAALDEQLKHEDEIRRLLGAENQNLFFDYDRMIGRRMAISERHV